MNPDAISIRAASAADERALWRLAALDDRAAPSGSVLVAESGGALVAAVEVESRRAIADPFKPTAPTVEMLMLRARQLAGRSSGERRRRASLARPRLDALSVTRAP